MPEKFDSVCESGSNLSLLLLIVGFIVTGCSGGPTAIQPPAVDIAAAAAAAMQSYDSDQDGKLADDELKACPALLEAMRRYDKDADKAITADELRQGLGELYGTGVGIFSLGCQVSYKGRALDGATVRLIPEPFLGDALKPAYGVTRSSGTAVLAIMPEDLPADLRTIRGVQTGLYKVEVFHPNLDIPPEYNDETTLGWEISPADQASGIRIKL